MSYGPVATFTLNPAAASTLYTAYTFGVGIFRVKINTFALPVNYLLDISLQQLDKSGGTNYYETSDGHADVTNVVAPTGTGNGSGPLWEPPFNISVPYGAVLVYQIIMLNGATFAALPTPLNGIVEQA